MLTMLNLGPFSVNFAYTPCVCAGSCIVIFQQSKDMHFTELVTLNCLKV